jgi:transcriptional regulator with XRE-family HTH domain
MYKVSQTLKNTREMRNLTQEQLAEMANLNRVTVAKYESGRVEPGAGALAKLADAMDVSADYLLSRETGDHTQIDPMVLALAQRISEDKRLMVLLNVASDATPEEKQAATAMLQSFQMQRGSVKA